MAPINLLFPPIGNNCFLEDERAEIQENCQLLSTHEPMSEFFHSERDNLEPTLIPPFSPPIDEKQTSSTLVFCYTNFQLYACLIQYRILKVCLELITYFHLCSVFFIIIIIFFYFFVRFLLLILLIIVISHFQYDDDLR